MKNWLMAVIFAVPVALLALSGAFCGGQPAGNAPPARQSKPADTRLKITQFYAAAGAVEPGGKTLLCYGVENAESVRLSPAVEAVKPAYSRCIEVTPARTTEYTLTAEAPGQPPVMAKATVQVKRGAAPAAAPAPAPRGPQIVSFHVGERREGVTLLCYEVEGAEAVAVEPGALPRTGALRGCFGVGRAGEYTLVAYGPGGQTARQKLTLP